ncbi:MAG: DUF2059 domain-containing protein [Halioglobus sp.]
MKLVNICLLIASLCFSSISLADPQAEKEAEKLLNVIGMEQSLVQSMALMLDLQLQQNPALGPYKQVMEEFFSKHMSYESLKSDMVKIYSEAFTASELSEINDFYSTKVGRKTIESMPALMAQGAQIGAARVQENIGELQAMIEAESERLQKLQQE